MEEQCAPFQLFCLKYPQKICRAIQEGLRFNLLNGKQHPFHHTKYLTYLTVCFYDRNIKKNRICLGQKALCSWLSSIMNLPALPPRFNQYRNPELMRSDRIWRKLSFFVKDYFQGTRGYIFIRWAFIAWQKISSVNNFARAGRNSQNDYIFKREKRLSVAIFSARRTLWKEPECQKQTTHCLGFIFFGISLSHKLNTEFLKTHSAKVEAPLTFRQSNNVGSRAYRWWKLKNNLRKDGW